MTCVALARSRLRRSALAVALIGGALLVPRPNTAAASKELMLKNPVWAVFVDPASLRVQAKPAGGSVLQISAAQATLGPVAHLKETAQQASWELPVSHIAVSM